MIPTSLRDLADTLCLPITAFWKYKGQLCAPFYRNEEQIIDEYTKRKEGKIEVNSITYTMAFSLNEGLQKKDLDLLHTLLKSWKEDHSMDWDQEHIFHCGMNSLKTLYEQRTLPTADARITFGVPALPGRTRAKR